MKKFFLVFLFCLITFSFPLPSFATSSYVLPYPSTMPGGINYKLHLVWEKIMHYWYFGDFGQFTYSLNESDKYVVEAKTLFEYNQFLLGYSALKKSNDYFVKTLPNLQNASLHGKNIEENKNLLHQAALKHIEILNKMILDTPSTVYWNPEKTKPTTLPIKDVIQKAIQIRQAYL